MKSNRCELGDIVDITSGYAFKSSCFSDKGELPIIRIRDVAKGSSSTYYSGAYSEDFVIQNGDLLISMDGEFRSAKWKGGKALLNQRVCRIAAHKDKLHQEYLKHFLPQELKRIEDRTPYVTVKHLSVKKIRKIALNLPPLSDQKRIAAILDKADDIRRKRRQAIDLTEELLRSTFLDMFGDVFENPNDLPVVKLKELCHRITDGTHQPPKWSESGIPFLFVSNIVNSEIDFTTKKFISESTWKELTDRCPIEVNDILYTTVGSYGNSALVKTDRKFSFQRHIAHIKPDADKVNPEFLHSMLISPAIKHQAYNEARGVAQKTLNLKELKSFKVFAPPKKLQQKFVTVKQRIIDMNKKEQKLHEESELLFNSLVQRAFKGEL